MYLKRFVYDRLLDWKNEGGHSTLEVGGARQVGKTYLIQKFADENYKHKIYINLFELSGRQFMECYKQATAWTRICRQPFSGSRTPIRRFPVSPIAPAHHSPSRPRQETEKAVYNASGVTVSSPTVCSSRKTGYLSMSRHLLAKKSPVHQFMHRLYFNGAGKQAKRRQWRIKRACFEEGSQSADTQDLLIGLSRRCIPSWAISAPKAAFAAAN